MPQTNFLDALAARFSDAIPHSKEAGIVVGSLAADAADLRLPYRADWLGDAERGLIATGIVTTLVDTACGLAVLAKLGSYEPIATLDLRMDYLRAAVAGRDLHCRAGCYRVTAHIAFVRARVWQDDPDAEVAVSHSVFMLGSRRRGASRGPL